MRSFLAMFCLILFLVGFGIYYGANIPVQKIAQNLLPLGIALVFVCSLCGLGWLLADRLVSAEDRWVQAIAAVAFGAGLTGVFNLITGLLFHYTATAFSLWHLLGLILFALALRRWKPFGLAAPARTSWNVMAIAVFAVFLIPMAPFFVAPEVSTDAITYHLLIPKIYLLHGKMHFLPLFVEASYPSLAELNYLPMLSLSGEIVCKCFHFWIGILVLLLISRLVKKVSPASGSLLAPALFLAMPVVVIHLGWAWNDFLFVMFILLSLYFLLEAHLLEMPGDAGARRRLGKQFLVAGIMAGLASWTKYTFVIYFLASLLLLLWGARKWKWNSAQYVYYFGGIALVAPFWLFQNWLFTGNPVYPFLNRIFGSPYWTEAANQYFIHHLRRYEIQDWNWTTYFTFPARITLRPGIIETHTGILPFAFIPLLLLRSPSRGYALLRAFLVCCILVWLLIQTETRSLLSVFAVFFCLASIQLQSDLWKTKLFKTVTIALIVPALAINFYIASITTHHLLDPVNYFLGLESRSHYLSRLSPGQQAFDYLNRDASVEKVLLVSLHGPFYLNQAYFFSDYSDPPIAEVLTQDTPSAEAIAQKFRRLKITHVVLNPVAYKKQQEDGLYSWTITERVRFETFIRKYCRQVAAFPDAFVFEFQSSNTGQE
jgi:hypothetical protein